MDGNFYESGILGLPFLTAKNKKSKRDYLSSFPSFSRIFQIHSFFSFWFPLPLRSPFFLPRLFINVCARIIFVCTPPPNLSHLLVGAARTVTPPPNVKLRDLSLSLRLLLPLHPFAPFPPPLSNPHYWIFSSPNDRALYTTCLLRPSLPQISLFGSQVPLWTWGKNGQVRCEFRSDVCLT